MFLKDLGKILSVNVFIITDISDYQISEEEFGKVYFSVNIYCILFSAYNGKAEFFWLISRA